MPRVAVIRLLQLMILLALAARVCAQDKPKAAETGPSLRGEVVDADSAKRLQARVYIRSAEGQWFFAKSASAAGSAVTYDKQRSPASVERHTTLSAHPFQADLPPGKYTVTVERGKEYFPVTQTVEVGSQPDSRTFRLRRWIDMAERGWYSGDTHVHRPLAELPNIVLAEDLNVSLPLTQWVTTAYTPPNRGNRNIGISAIAPSGAGVQRIHVDRTHVIYPLNTEYEIGRVEKKGHTLGAFFVLNHRRPLTMGAPPVGPIAEEARRQGAILDLDKHSWPWSLMLVPVMNVDLFELANNHVWRTEFAFRSWTIDKKPEFLTDVADERGWTEQGWIDFGFEVYYTLLNCGFRMRPTAGTASGVHPVPLGFGRVYVQLTDGFDYDAWMQGLAAGRSFVTTGPMLFVQYNGRPPGHVFTDVDQKNAQCQVKGTAESGLPLDRIEILVNGEVARTVKPANQRSQSVSRNHVRRPSKAVAMTGSTALEGRRTTQIGAPAYFGTSSQKGGHVSPIDETIPVEGTSWVVVRCFEKHPDGRVRFAHGSPVHFEVPGKPLRPRRERVEYLIGRMEQEIARNTGVLKPAEVDEYRQALQVYRRIATNAR